VIFVSFVVVFWESLMAIKVSIPTLLREHTGGQTTVEAGGDTVKAALDDLCAKFPALAAKIFDRGQVRMHLNVFLNEEDIRYLDELNTKVKAGDALDIIPSVAGG
jgi:molybdopterin converting factor small subunit